MNNYRTEEKNKNMKLLKKVRAQLPEFMQDYFTYLITTRNLSPRTVLGYARDLEIFCLYLKEQNPLINDYNDITPDLLDCLKMKDITEYLIFLDSYKRENDVKDKCNNEEGRARKLSALKSFWKWATQSEVLQSNPTILVAAPRLHNKEVVQLNPDESSSLLKAVQSGASLTDNQLKNSRNLIDRDAAIIALFLGTGIRVSELVGIDMKDIDFKENSILITSKGGDQKKVYFSGDVKEFLLQYIENTRREPADGSDALFLSRRGTRLSVRGVEHMVKKHTKNTIPQKRIYPHRFRSSYGTHVYLNSKDLFLASDALGHKNLSSVKRYIRIDEERRKSVANMVNELISSDDS